MDKDITRYGLAPVEVTYEMMEAFNNAKVKLPAGGQCVTSQQFQDFRQRYKAMMDVAPVPKLFMVDK